MRDLLSRIWRTLALLSALALIQGCASLAKGVTEAILEGDDAIEERVCRIEGAPFRGLETAFDDARMTANSTALQDMRTMRMLVVHGIGPHSEDYSESFVRSMARELDLGSRDVKQKRVRLRVNREDAFGRFSSDPLGSLLITRYFNEAEGRELLAFELLWSDYNKDDREGLAESDEDTAKLRAAINDQVKQFFNKQVVDPLKYLGDNSEKIRLHVRQAACWMVSYDWAGYEDNFDRREVCPGQLTDAETVRRVDRIIADDTFVAVTHSLGSRIFLDAFTVRDRVPPGELNPFATLATRFRDKQSTLIMLANQLPLLQLGLNSSSFGEPVPVNGGAAAPVPWKNSERYDDDNRVYAGFGHYDSKAELCRSPEAVRYFRNLEVVSVSDPNDILSYRLFKNNFAEEYIDWALCPTITEVTMAVVKPTNLFGINFANPGDAHGNYWTDAGLAQLLAEGFGRGERKNPVFAADANDRPVRNLDDEEAIARRYRCDGTIHKEDGWMEDRISVLSGTVAPRLEAL